jgi:hypothetical protein
LSLSRELASDKRYGGNVASSVPCRTGKTRESFFRDFPYAEKASAIIDLLLPFGNNRRLGREPAGKAKMLGSRSGITRSLLSYKLIIDNCAWFCHMVPNFAMASGRRGSR